MGVTSAREGKKREKTVTMSPNCLMVKDYGRIDRLYEPELHEREGVRSHRQVL